MASSALVVSDDLILRSNARQVLKKTGIDCISSGTIGLNKTIISSKFDAVILDYPVINEVIIAIQSVRTGKVNRYSIILALVSDSSAAAMARGAGANFTIQRSSALLENMERAVQSAYALIVRERRRYERHPVSVSVEVLCNGRRSNGKMIDISTWGLYRVLSSALHKIVRARVLASRPESPAESRRHHSVDSWLRNGNTLHIN